MQRLPRLSDGVSILDDACLTDQELCSSFTESRHHFPSRIFLRVHSHTSARPFDYLSIGSSDSVVHAGFSFLNIELAGRSRFTCERALPRSYLIWIVEVDNFVAVS